MSTALVSAFYDVDDVLYQVSILFNNTRDSDRGKNGKFSVLDDNLLQPYWKENS